MSEIHMGSAPEIELNDNVDESLKVLFYLSLFRNEANHLRKFLNDIKETKDKIKTATDLLQNPSNREVDAPKK